MDTLEQTLVTIYDQLREISRNVLRRERWEHTLQTTALVNEALLRVLGPNWQIPTTAPTPAELINHVRWAMRQVLIDYARKSETLKRDPQRRKNNLEASHERLSYEHTSLVDMLDAIAALRDVDTVSADVMELRFVSGFTVVDVAEMLDLTRSQVKDKTVFGRAWLFQKLSPVMPSLRGSANAASDLESSPTPPTPSGV
jgi:RNA polymerase sigma-70 factor, ECF subfamily